MPGSTTGYHPANQCSQPPSNAAPSQCYGLQCGATWYGVIPVFILVPPSCLCCYGGGLAPTSVLVQPQACMYHSATNKWCMIETVLDETDMLRRVRGCTPWLPWVPFNPSISVVLLYNLNTTRNLCSVNVIECKIYYKYREISWSWYSLAWKSYDMRVSC